MKKRFLALFLALLALILCACGGEKAPAVTTEPHEHVFDQRNTDEKYLRSEATCKSTDRYYYSCVCGEIGTATFGYGPKEAHTYTKQDASKKYLLSDATCSRGGIYSVSCEVCGAASDILTFVSGQTKAHSFSVKRPDGKYIKTEATSDAAATYYYSCTCGEIGETSFTSGEALREYSAAEKEALKPISLTVSLYDSKEMIYGFTCNSVGQPLRPVIELVGGGETVTAPAKVDKCTSYDENDNVISYYVMKFEAKLKASTTYTYRIYDMYANTEGVTSTITTCDSHNDSFTFVHLGDTQTSSGAGGTIYSNVLDNIVGKADFIVHTGDMVEWSKYEYEWEAMLHTNFDKLSKIPVMAVSGNHETTYQNGSNETFKHFNYNIPEQQTTETGFFYSFEYGNVKFIMVNTNRLKSNKLTADQYNWLVNELSGNTQDWLVVSLHNPMYSPGPWGSDTSRNQITLSLREQLYGIFAEYGVDLVLQGHDHVVSRTFPINASGEVTDETVAEYNGIDYVVDPDGVIYVMSGTAGNHFRNLTVTDRTLYKYQSSTSTQYWTEFTVEGSRITVNVMKIADGTAMVYKSWGIEKTDVK